MGCPSVTCQAVCDACCLVAFRLSRSVTGVSFKEAGRHWGYTVTALCHGLQPSLSAPLKLRSAAVSSVTQSIRSLCPESEVVPAEQGIISLLIVTEGEEFFKEHCRACSMLIQRCRDNSASLFQPG